MVKMRLARRGRKKLALYDIVVADARSPRDGRFIEKIGTYNPNTNPATIVLNDEKALQWLFNGAQPTDTVRAILSYKGILFRKHLQVGVRKGAISQEQADERFNAWLQQKESKITGKVDILAAQKEAAQKSRLEAESKVREAREAALRQKQTTQEAPITEETPSEPTTEG